MLLNSILAILLDRFSDEQEDTNAEIEEEYEDELNRDATLSMMVNK